jgi:phage FluMu gp28-like protein
MARITVKVQAFADARRDAPASCDGRTARRRMSALELGLEERRAENAAGEAALERCPAATCSSAISADDRQAHGRRLAAGDREEPAHRRDLGTGVLRVLTAAAQISAGGQNVWYMGYDKDMALEFIDVCAMWARAFGIVADDVGEELLDVDGVNEGVQSFRIRFASGFKITALPSVPGRSAVSRASSSSTRRRSTRTSTRCIKSAMALLIWGGQVIIVSTHDGVGNRFNQLLDEIRSGRRRGEVMTITFADAMADGLYERVQLVAKTKGIDLPPKDQWEADIRASYGEDAGEELDCIPKTGAGSLIKPEDIAAAEHDDAGKPELYGGGLVYVGRDVARRRDGAIIYPLELVGDVLWERDHYEGYNTTFAEQDAYFDDCFVNYRVAYAGIDQTGMGEPIVEKMQLKYGESRVNGVLLTGPNRLDLAISLQQRFERGLIRIRKGDARLRADLRAIKRAGSDTGGVRIVNEGEVHADHFWALALASRGADMPFQEFGYHSANRGVGGRCQRPRPVAAHAIACGRTTTATSGMVTHGGRFGAGGAW